MGLLCAGSSRTEAHMSRFTLRPMRPSDGPGIEMVHRRAIMDLAGRTYTETECRSWAHKIRADRYVQIARERETFIVAENAVGVIAGFCSFALQDDAKGRVAGLYTDPAFQGSGLGTALIGQAEAAMIADGATILVIEASLAALPFYRARGYTEIKRASRTTRGGVRIEVAHVEKPAAIPCL